MLLVCSYAIRSEILQTFSFTDCRVSIAAQSTSNCAEEGFTADPEVFHCCAVFNHVSIYMKNCMRLLRGMVTLFAHISREITWSALACLSFQYLTRAQSGSALLTVGVSSRAASQVCSASPSGHRAFCLRPEETILCILHPDKREMPRAAGNVGACRGLHGETEPARA